MGSGRLSHPAPPRSPAPLPSHPAGFLPTAPPLPSVSHRLSTPPLRHPTDSLYPTHRLETRHSGPHPHPGGSPVSSGPTGFPVSSSFVVPPPLPPSQAPRLPGSLPTLPGSSPSHPPRLLPSHPTGTPLPPPPATPVSSSSLLPSSPVSFFLFPTPLSHPSQTLSTFPPRRLLFWT